MSATIGSLRCPVSLFVPISDRVPVCIDPALDLAEHCFVALRPKEVSEAPLFLQVLFDGQARFRSFGVPGSPADAFLLC
jgi:hypothetical protein